MTAFLLHIGSLFFSFWCYVTAALVIGRNPSRGDQIAKLVLWFLPIIVEVVIHFIAAGVPGRVRYPALAIYERSSTVFIIILGGGLDKITNGFQYIVGNVSISGESIGLIFCGVLIVILLFTLYFGTSDGDKLGSRRALALFFFNYFYLSALIVTLQGIAAMLKVGVSATFSLNKAMLTREAESKQCFGSRVPLCRDLFGEDLPERLAPDHRFRFRRRFRYAPGESRTLCGSFPRASQ